jgi:hypothetical protein
MILATGLPHQYGQGKCCLLQEGFFKLDSGQRGSGFLIGRIAPEHGIICVSGRCDATDFLGCAGRERLGMGGDGAECGKNLARRPLTGRASRVGLSPRGEAMWPLRGRAVRPSFRAPTGWGESGERNPDLSTGRQDLDFGNGPKWGPAGVKWDW